MLDLSTTARNFITPLIEVPEMGFDFEKGAESKTIDRHVEPFAKRVHTKWGTHPCFVDVLHIPSKKVIADGSYMGPSFSEGDRYISECAAGSASTGNLTTWRKVGTNHHLEKVVSDVSNLFGSDASFPAERGNGEVGRVPGLDTDA